MDLDLPRRPDRISREQARTAKAREKLFEFTLKARARASGWGYAGGRLFRQHGDWFVDVSSYLMWERGVGVRLNAKPMAVDPIFWSIVGLPENERLPLSFRANGAWVLSSPSLEAQLALEEQAPERLAEEVLLWSAEQLAKVSASSVEAQLMSLSRSPGRHHHVALEVCLHLLRGDHESAQELCRDRPPGDSGGFMTGSQSFFDQARAWIVAKRRGEIEVI